MGLHQVEQSRTFAAPRALVWAIVADTNRWDRAAGLAPPQYEWSRENGKNVRLARASELGVALTWVEPPYQWVEGRLVAGERRFREGPVETGGFRVELEDAPGGTLVRATAYVEAGVVIGSVQKLKFARALPAYLDGVAELLGQAGDATADTLSTSAPAVVQARRVLWNSYSLHASGPRSASNPQALATRERELRSRGVADSVVARLVEHLRARADEDLSAMRPFELAAVWGLPRRDVLRAFLHATEVGLTELAWQVNCPVCRVGARTAPHLGELGDKQHCGACSIDYEVDFARHVEAVFPIHPAIRKVEPKLYCASSPAFLPHVVAQLRARPGETIERVADVPVGELLVRSLWTRASAELDVDVPPARIEAVLSADRLELRVEPGTGAATTLVFRNETSDEATVLFERAGWSADTVLGTAIASMPEFATLFATEAPASGVELRVGHIALLFSDLTGSTALYEQVGDARAFAIVEEHFQLMSRAVERHGGGVVKTMGDAVMASFPTLDDALAAALDMIETHDRHQGGLGLGVKIGIHAGPCLAVRANERLDYFGTTVNVAARLQAQAGAGQVVLTERAASEPPIEAMLKNRERVRFEARLKGIRDEQRLVAVRGAVEPS